MKDQTFKDVLEKMVDLAADPRHSVDVLMLSTNNRETSIFCKEMSGKAFTMSIKE